MSFDAGSIESRLVVARDEFNRGLDQAKADAAKFSDKPITVKVKADAADARKTFTDVRKNADSLGRKTAVVRVRGDSTHALADFDKTAAKADQLSKKTPVVKVKADTAEADAALDRVEAKKARAGRRVTIPVTADTRQADDLLDKVTAKVQNLAGKLKDAGGPFWLGPALLSVGALGTSAGVATGAAVGLAGAFTAGAGAIAAFGAVAKPVLSGAEAAQKAAAASTTAYNTAIGKAAAQYQIASGAAKTHAQQVAALSALRKADATAAANQALAVKTAYAGMSQAQVDLSRQLGAMSQGWKNLQAAQAPVVAGALVPWLTDVTSLTRQLPPIIAAVAPVIKGLGTQFGDLVNSQAFTRFRDFIAGTGTATVSAAGSTIIDLVKSFITLLPQFDPLIREAVNHIADLGPAVLKWSQSKQASDDIQKFMQWFNANGPQVGGFLKSIGGALKALAPGLTAGGTGELQVLTGFFSLIAKLPPSFARPIAEVAGWLLLLNKLGVVSVGVKIIGAAAGWVKKLLSGAVADIGAAAMQTAADTMAAAAAAMQRAADTMIGADAGAGGAAKGAGAAAGSAEGSAVGAGLGSRLLAGGLLAAIAAAIALLVVKPLLKGQSSGTQQDSTKPGNWWDNPGGSNPTDPRTAGQGWSTWAGAGTQVKDWLGFGQSTPAPATTPATGQRSPGGVTGAAFQAPVIDPNTGEMAWTKWWQDFDQHFIHKITNWFTQSLPHLFTSTVPHAGDVAWNTLWANTITRAARGLHDVAVIFDALRHQVAVDFDGMRHEVAHVWDIIYANTIGAVIRLGKDAIAHLKSGFISPFQSGLKNAWNWVWANVWTPVSTFFTRTLPHWWDLAAGFLKTRLVSPLEGGLKDAWNWLVSNFAAPLDTFFTRTLPGYWNRAIGFLRTNFVNPLEGAFKGTWNWLMANFGTPIARWLTQTLPGAFATGVAKIKSAWSGITNAFIGPARTVVNNVINPLIADADAVLSFVHLPQIPKVPKFAKGTGGAPPGWAWVGEQGPELIWMKGGEHVLPSPLSQRLAGAGMFPGYATGTPSAGGGGNPGGLGGVFGHVTGAISSALNWAKNLTLGALAATFTPVADGLLNLMPKPTSGAEGMIEAVPRILVSDLISFIKSKDPGAGVGGGSGASVANYAKTFATGLGHPYVLGGASPNGWDCSGFSAFIYEHFGYFPEKQGNRHGTSESQFVDPLTQSSGNQTGALVFFNDGIFANPGHVGIALNPSAYVSASGTAVGTIVAPISGAVGYRVPKGGFVAPGAGSLGPGSSNYAADITTVLRSMGLPLTLVGNWLAQIQTESGGNLGAVNRTDCVTLDYMILTQRGWLHHDQVQAGDQTIGYNPRTQRSEWTAVTRVVRYDDAEVWRIGNKNWHADVTPNHRWWSETETTRSDEQAMSCPECGWAGRTDPVAIRQGITATPRSISTHRGRVHGMRTMPMTSYEGEFVTTAALGSHHRLRLAAPADTDGIPGLTLDDARIIAWLQGDGTIAPRMVKPVTCPECGWAPAATRHQPGTSVAVHRARAHGMTKDRTACEPDGWKGSIWQAKPEMLIRLRALLAHVAHYEYTQHRDPRYLPAWEFRLDPAFVTDLLKRSRVMETGPEAFVLALSPDQRAAWLDSMIDAEGNRQPVAEGAGRRGAAGEFVRIAQVDGPLQDAIKLAVYLEGFRPTYSRLTRREARYKPAGHVGMARPHVVPSMFDPPVVQERQPVFCVSTELGSWTARGGDDLPFLTGNSNAAAGHPSVGLLTFATHSWHFRRLCRAI